ncbi:MAG: alpha/beta hydrolase [Clostridiales bacterium]|nr:alpha/beta hydrolase [Clostridiales bacterium]
MEYFTDKGRIYYEIKGEGEPILFLHGWGGSTVSFEGACNALSDSFRCISLDFYGFGRSGEVTGVYGIREYAEGVCALIGAIGAGRVNIVAHSFGGRAAIYIAALHPELVNKIILIDSAGIRPRRGLKYYYGVLSYKLKKRLGYDVSGCGSADYRALSDNMRAVFKYIVNEDLSRFLRFVRAETLILWGADDRETPLYMARKLKRKIAGSSLFVFPNGGHYSYIDNHNAFVASCKSFFGGADR